MEAQSDYCMKIDAEWALDGAERAKDTSRFSGCHLNHSRQRFNIARRTLRKERRVELFAVRDIRFDALASRAELDDLYCPQTNVYDQVGQNLDASDCAPFLMRHGICIPLVVGCFQAWRRAAVGLWQKLLDREGSQGVAVT
jgi:hypothetical protein